MASSGNHAIVVLGMHRCGTSAVAGALRLLGADLPANLIPTAPDNPAGFWEAMSVLGVNDWILRQGAATWYDCLTFDEAALDTRTRAIALTFVMLSLMAEFEGAALPVIKDPRICLVVDMWFSALRARGTTPVAMLVVRPPEAVAASLDSRNHLPTAVSAALWLRYMLAAERATRGCRRHILSYDDLLTDWPGALTLASGRLGLAWPVSLDVAAPAMDRFLDPQISYVGRNGARMKLASLPFGVWLEEAHAALRGLARDGEDPRQMDRLDRVHIEFLTWCRAHGTAWSGVYLQEHPIRADRPFPVPIDWHRIAGEIPDAISLSAD